MAIDLHRHSVKIWLPLDIPKLIHLPRTICFPFAFFAHFTILCLKKDNTVFQTKKIKIKILVTLVFSYPRFKSQNTRVPKVFVILSVLDLKKSNIPCSELPSDPGDETSSKLMIHSKYNVF